MTHGKARVGMYWHGKNYKNFHYILLAGGQNGHGKLGNLLEISTICDVVHKCHVLLNLPSLDILNKLAMFPVAASRRASKDLFMHHHKKKGCAILWSHDSNKVSKTDMVKKGINLPWYINLICHDVWTKFAMVWRAKMPWSIKMKNKMSCCTQFATFDILNKNVMFYSWVQNVSTLNTMENCTKSCSTICHVLQKKCHVLLKFAISNIFYKKLPCSHGN